MLWGTCFHFVTLVLRPHMTLRIQDVRKVSVLQLSWGILQDTIPKRLSQCKHFAIWKNTPTTARWAMSALRGGATFIEEPATLGEGLALAQRAF
eukprot:1976837-Amphidinium_carterae.1